MAKIALIDATPGVVTAVEAVAAGHELVACDRRAVPADVALVIVDVNGSGPVARDSVAEGGAPTLLLVERRVFVSEAIFDARGVALLRKPFDLFELRLKLRGLLGAGFLEAPPQSVSAPLRPPATVLDWLSSPVVPASAAPTLAAALGLSTSLWLVGEGGTGRGRVAGAFVRRRHPSPRLLSWHLGEDFAPLALQCSGDGAGKDAASAGVALFVPDVDVRPLSDQRRLEEFLSLHPSAVIIATAGDDPGEAVVAGTLSRGLYHLLARVAVRLPPLRERRSDIATLAQALANQLAVACCDGAAVAFTDAACEKLELYPWPGNLAELEGVIARSLIAAARPGNGGAGKLRAAQDCVIDAADLVFAPALAALGLGEVTQPAAVSAAARRGAVVVTLGATGSSEPLAELPADSVAPAPARAVATSVSPTAIEPVLAALAHDLRNPMTTLKTFAALAAERATSDPDTAALASEAVAACSRIDTHVELLHEYAALGAAEAMRIDLVALFAETIEEARLPVAAVVNARRALWAIVDPRHARFIAGALLEESRERLAQHDEAWVDVTDAESVLEVCIPRGGRAVEHLERWLDGDAWPWRLALAREVARRGGGDLQLQVEQDELRVQWRAPLAEEASDGQAGRIDSRRRSRSS